MTREEAIECLSERVGIGGTSEQSCTIGFGVNINLLDEAIDMAISALRAQQEPFECPHEECEYNANPICCRGKERCPHGIRRNEGSNDPLTLDELREMAQRCEAVYVAHVDGSSVFRGQRYCAAVLDLSLAFGSTTLHVHAIYGDRLTLWADDYGKTWLAYRRKPEEADHEQ